MKKMTEKEFNETYSIIENINYVSQEFKITVNKNTLTCDDVPEGTLEDTNYENTESTYTLYETETEAELYESNQFEDIKNYIKDFLHIELID